MAARAQRASTKARATSPAARALCRRSRIGRLSGAARSVTATKGVLSSMAAQDNAAEITLVTLLVLYMKNVLCMNSVL